MSDFVRKYWKVRDEKNSVLCVGLDPSPDEVREENILGYCLDIVERTSDYAMAYKPNSQFILFTLKAKELSELNKKIHQKRCLSILDHKLSDIGSSNAAAIYHIRAAGFDALTASPFPGNIKETTDACHRNGLGVIFLALMSNSQAAWIQKESTYNGRPLYHKIAKEAREAGADGLVVGATGHVTDVEMRTAREIVGSTPVFLCPGIGAQGGDIEKVIRSAGQNVLLNVGRSILADPAPGSKAKQYRDLMNKYR